MKNIYCWFLFTTSPFHSYHSFFLQMGHFKGYRTRLNDNGKDLKIPFLSFERDGIGQNPNLAHARLVCSMPITISLLWFEFSDKTNPKETFAWYYSIPCPWFHFSKPLLIKNIYRKKFLLKTYKSNKLEHNRINFISRICEAIFDLKL